MSVQRSRRAASFAVGNVACSATFAVCSSKSCAARAQGCKRPFVAYFGGAGTGGHARLHAWLSRSTHGARERMRAEPHSLRFTMPLAPQARLPPFVHTLWVLLLARATMACGLVSPGNACPSVVCALGDFPISTGPGDHG